MTEEEPTTEELIDTAKVLRSQELAAMGEWRSELERQLWAADYLQLARDGVGMPAIIECCNLRESLRLSVQVDEALNDQALQRCMKQRREMFFENEELAHERCVRDFGIRARLFGEKAFESETIQKLDSQYAALKLEITKLQFNHEDPKTAHDAEILARRKLKLPAGISLTKTDEDARKEQNTLKRVPKMYGKTKDEVHAEVRKARSAQP